jgi:4-amino-4-deoxy-L-arabinose transferase-like glycosyltransferase
VYVLTDEQIAFILNDIRRNGIELEELQLDLLDHICCVIESEVTPEKNFEEVYRSILPRFYKRSLREIEEETQLLLTFKNYYAMKKVMIISGTFSAFTFTIGSLFKIMHWPGAALLLQAGIVFFCFLFLPILSILKVKEQKQRKDKLLIGIATIFAIVICLATLFKVMHWPFATLLWTSALAILFFIFLPIYFFGGIRNPETKTNTIVSSILILIAGGLLFLITNLRGSHAFDEAISNADEQLIENYQLLSQYKPNDTLANQQLNENATQLCALIETLKVKLTSSVSNDGKDMKESDAVLLKGHIIEPIQTQLFDKNGKVKAGMKTIQLNVKAFEELASTKINWNAQQLKDLPLSYVLRNLNLLLLRIKIVQHTNH